MISKEAIKRLRQETCPATYMSDFDKEECLQVVEKDLNNYENLKQIINEEFKGLTCAMGENLDFSDEEDVKHYDCLKAKAEILEKIIRHIERY